MRSPSSLSVYSYSSATQGSPAFNSDPFPVPPACPVKDEISGAFLDINGDCHADLVIKCGDKLTVLLNGDDGFKDILETPLDPGSGMISYADFDLDAAVDIVYPICESSKCRLVFFMNQQKPYCSSASETNCKPIKEENICQRDERAGFQEGINKVCKCHVISMSSNYNE